MPNLSAPSANVQLTNKGFLQLVFGHQWENALVSQFPGDPGVDRPGKWTSRRAGDLAAGILEDHSLNQYWTVSLFQGAHRREADFQAQYAVVVDDVGGTGQKMSALRLYQLLGQPTYRLETSPGNEQWGYVLETPHEDIGQLKAVVSAIISQVSYQAPTPGQLAKDPGMKGVTRLVRLPGGTNRKPGYGPHGFVCAVRTLDPMNLFALDKMAAALGTALPVPGTHVPGESDMPPVTAIDTQGDVVLEAMKDLGWVRGTKASGWGYDVRCPQIAGHTKAVDTGCAYRPGPRGFWRCFHGSCQGRHWESFYAGVSEGLTAAGLAPMALREFEDQRDVTDDELGLEDYDKPPAAKFLREFVWIAAQDAFYSLRSRQFVPRRAVNVAHAQALRDVLAVPAAKPGGAIRFVPVDKWFFMQDEGQHADELAYWPGRERVFQEGAGVFINTYDPAPRPRRGMSVSKTDIRPWLELVRHVLGHLGPRVLVRFLDWCAAIVGDPALKPGWMVCVQGAQGLGKDMMMQPVVQAVGPDNALPIKGEDLAGNFNTWQSRRLVVVSELKQTTVGSSTGHDQYNALKRIVDRQSPVVRINPKYGRTYEARNTCAVFTSTNEESAIALEHDDRRVLVAMSEAKPWHKRTYAVLAGWLEREGAALVGEWLHQRWEGMGSRRRGFIVGDAPDTEDKRKMFIAGDQVRHWLAERFAEPASPEWPDVMTAGDVVVGVRSAKSLTRSGLTDRAQVPTGTQAGVLLRGLGAVRLNNGVPVLCAGKQVRFWAVRRPTHWLQFEGAALVAQVKASGREC